MKTLAVIVMAIAVAASGPVQARDIIEQDARKIAATSAGMDTSDISEVYLIVRGDTGGCGRIETPTWVVMFKSEVPGGAEMGLAPEVFIDARTGKVRNCRR